MCFLFINQKSVEERGKTDRGEHYKNRISYSSLLSTFSTDHKCSHESTLSKVLSTMREKVGRLLRIWKKGDA